MKQERSEELEQIWQGLILLGDELNREDLEKVLINYNQYKKEITLMAKLRYIGKLKNTYPNIQNFMKRDVGEIIAMVQSISETQEQNNTMKLRDYARMFSEEIRRRDNAVTEKLAETKIFVPRGKELGDD